VGSPKTKQLKKADGTNALMRAEKDRGGRPSSLTPDVQKKIVSAIAIGGYIETAAAFAGVSKPTLYDWLKRGNRELDSQKKGNLPNKKELKFVRFLNAANKAIAENELKSLDRLEAAAMDGEWRVDTWMLERKHPTKWGNKLSVAPSEGHKDADDSINDIIADELEKLGDDGFED